MKVTNLAKRIMCIGLVLAMALLSAACRKAEDDSSYTYSEYYIIEEEESGEGDTTTTDSGSKTSSTANSTSSGSKTNSSSSSNKGIKGSTVKVLLWYDVPERESSVAEAFTKKTGCKVQFIKTSNGNYQTKLASLVASGSAPDCAAVMANQFPTVAIRGLFEPLDEKQFNLSSSVWNKSAMDAYKWNGKYYGVAATGSMFGDFYCVFYNKTLFEERGQTTPYEVWKKNPNDWTWSRFRQMCKDMTFGTGDNKVYGLSVEYSQAFMLSTGKDFVNVSGNKITNTANDNDVKYAWKFINDMLDVDKSINRQNSAISDLINRKAAMFLSGQWMMQTEREFAQQMKDDWGVAPFPKYDNASTYYAPYRGCMWGVGKGAKNVAGAAAFLEYWLNPKNEESAVYASEECREVHNWMWNQAKGVTYSEGVLTFKEAGYYGKLKSSIMGGSENVDSIIDSNMGTINSAIAAVSGEIK